MDMDYECNLSCPRGKEVEISKPTSKVHVYVIPTDEERMIVLQTLATLFGVKT